MTGFLHQFLIEKGAQYLLWKGCHIVITEMLCFPEDGIVEIPDIMGFSYRTSILIEAKTSIQDLKRDKEKVHRRLKGIGEFRYYLIQENLIQQNAEKFIPEGWGLLYLDNRGSIEEKLHSRHFETDWRRERHFLISALRRLNINQTRNVFIKRVASMAEKTRIILRDEEEEDYGCEGTIYSNEL